MFNFYSNLEIILINILITIIIIFIYDLIKKRGKLELHILKMRVNFLNKNDWVDSKNSLEETTKLVELDFILQVCNNKNSYNNIYNLTVCKKLKKKYYLTFNPALNLSDTMKSISGTTSYQKLKFINLHPFEIQEFHLKIKLTKEEFENIKN